MANKYNSEYNKKKLIAAMEKTLGVVSAACKECDISRNTYYEYYRSDPEFKRAIDDIYEIQLDFAENALLKKIKEGSSTDIQFLLKHKGKKRGYNGDNSISNGDIQIIINRPNKNED